MVELRKKMNAVSAVAQVFYGKKDSVIVTKTNLIVKEPAVVV